MFFNYIYVIYIILYSEETCYVRKTRRKLSSPIMHSKNVTHSKWIIIL